MGMLLEEFDVEKYERTMKKEGYEEGKREGYEPADEPTDDFPVRAEPHRRFASGSAR